MKAVCDPKPQRINPGRRPDRTGANDGADATAAIGANDIRPRDGSSGSGHRRKNRACNLGSPDLRKLEIPHLLWIRRA